MIYTKVVAVMKMMKKNNRPETEDGNRTQIYSFKHPGCDSSREVLCKIDDASLPVDRENVICIM